MLALLAVVSSAVLLAAPAFATASCQFAVCETGGTPSIAFVQDVINFFCENTLEQSSTQPGCFGPSTDGDASVLIGYESPGAPLGPFPPKPTEEVGRCLCRVSQVELRSYYSVRTVSRPLIRSLRRALRRALSEALQL